MKKIIAIVALATPIYANAGTQEFVADLEGGGQLALGKEVCTYKVKPDKAILSAYHLDDNGKISLGCWGKLDSKRIWVNLEGFDGVYIRGMDEFHTVERN